MGWGNTRKYGVGSTYCSMDDIPEKNLTEKNIYYINMHYIIYFIKADSTLNFICVYVDLRLNSLHGATNNGTHCWEM